jgi:hypothetical protein
VIASFPAPVVDLDILTTIEYWVFRLGLLIVFVAWILRHVIHELKAVIPAIRELRQIWRNPPVPDPPKVVSNPSP